VVSDRQQDSGDAVQGGIDGREDLVVDLQKRL
jgi:hypothetical protein